MAVASTGAEGGAGHTAARPHVLAMTPMSSPGAQDIDVDDVMDVGIPISQFDTQATAMSFRVKRKKSRLFGQGRGPSEAHDTLGPGLRRSGSTSSLTLWQRVRVALGRDGRSSRGSQDVDFDVFAGDTYESSSCVDMDDVTDTGALVPGARATIRQRLREHHHMLAELGGVDDPAIGKLPGGRSLNRACGSQPGPQDPGGYPPTEPKATESARPGCVPRRMWS
ncbi:hypothetical protein CXG81DRAFT_28718 [Caulochytrium protostelioides]|uniref:Uncharacterized protein n=1 Tax=Caulochytrium protostelioides TaxID=1555241 RepID=A0A4P9WYD2_9FUNG|nr:hypothetical protein CXG81DRAFT_28718 [Caulochytrium protostelioides]|eukprot:RKO98454.1 hypothetical protein CXG81DRAFT_28718 [Caulochytrium protostelioides]